MMLILSKKNDQTSYKKYAKTINEHKKKKKCLNMQFFF